MGHIKTSKYTNVTEQEFNNMKMLQEAGLKASKAARVVGRTTPTVSKVYSSKDWEAYKAPKEKPFEEVFTLDEPGEKTTDVEDNTLILQNINDSLVAINERLEWLADNVVVQEPRKWFTGRKY